MKIKDNFMLREISGAWVVVPVGQASVDFNGLINLNETAAFMWQGLSNNITPCELVSAITEKYDVSKEKAEADVSAFIDKLREADLLDE